MKEYVHFSIAPSSLLLLPPVQQPLSGKADRSSAPSAVVFRWHLVARLKEIQQWSISCTQRSDYFLLTERPPEDNKKQNVVLW